MRNKNFENINSLADENLNNVSAEAEQKEAKKPEPTETVERKVKKPTVLNSQQIDEWKKEYGHIFKTQIDDVSIIWRRLKRNEYVNLMTDSLNEEESNVDKRIFTRQEEVLKTVALYPDNIDEIIEDMGGIATNIAEDIMKASGFGGPETTEI